jgi:ABC-type oligopeptide transport system substrate-binding subunit
MRKGKIFLVIALVAFVAIGFASCGGSDSQANTPSTDTSKVNGPAPDNNSATNPSLADTNYSKNASKPITDTMHQDTSKPR